MESTELIRVLGEHDRWVKAEGGGRAYLRGADLSGADLRRADLRRADLSGATGLLCAADYLAENLERTDAGYIVYKSFGKHYSSPKRWVIERGQILNEVCNPLSTFNCACGINVATKDWPGLSDKGVWRALIRWEWLADVVVPYNTDGKFRCGRIELLEPLDDAEQRKAVRDGRET